MANEENGVEQPKITLHTTENTFSFCYDAATGCVKLGWTGYLADSERDLVKYLAMCAFEDRNSYKEGFEDGTNSTILSSDEIVDIPWARNDEPMTSGHVYIDNTVSKEPEIEEGETLDERISLVSDGKAEIA